MDEIDGKGVARFASPQIRDAEVCEFAHKCPLRGIAEDSRRLTSIGGDALEAELTSVNRQIVLQARPEGAPRESDFLLVETPVPTIAPGELLVRSHYLSVDPLQRLRMNATSTYGKTIPLGTVVWGRMVGAVVQSRHPDFREGDFVEGMLGWQDFAVSEGRRERAEYAPGVVRVDPALAPISTALGILGMPGVTAYFAMLELGRPRPGETVVVSGAAGTVGALAGQIARIAGARTVGIAGSDAKCEHLIRDLGFDAAINYRAASDLLGALKAACPEGVDVYFDNVGGAVRDTVLQHLRRSARIALVGRIAHLNDAGTPLCRDPQVALMHARASMHGFIVYDYEHRADEARRAIAGWLAAGSLTYRETITEGLENTPRAFIDMLRGGNFGKALVRV